MHINIIISNLDISPLLSLSEIASTTGSDTENYQSDGTGKTITPLLAVSTYIFTRITAHPTGLATIR